MSLTIRLYDLLATRFSASDLRQLVEFDKLPEVATLSTVVNFNLPGAQVASDLVKAAELRNLLPALAEAAARARPQVPEASELTRLFATVNNSDTPEEQEVRPFVISTRSLYERLGYKTIDTTESMNLDGVDFILERVVKGIGTERHAAVCVPRTHHEQKWNKAIEKRLVAARDNGFISSAAVVFEEHAQVPIAKATNRITWVNMLSQLNLEEDLFQSLDLLKEQVEIYERREIYTTYISQSGTLRSPATASGQELPNAEEYLLQWIGSDSNTVIAILAAFGSGKTTLMERLRYRIAKNYQDGIIKCKPIFLILREFQSLNSVEGLIRSSIRRDYLQDVSMNWFWKALDRGEIVVLLDGFDEMSPNASRDERIANMISLTKIFSSRAKCIISCRPEAFVNDAEYRSAIEAAGMRAPLTSEEGDCARPSNSLTPTTTQLAKRRKEHLSAIRDALREKFMPRATAQLPNRTLVELYLDLFDKNQIKNYLINNEKSLTKILKCKLSDIEKWLLQVYDIKDLIQRPILLAMIVETLRTGHIDIQDKERTIGPAELYEEWTSLKLDIESQKQGRGRLTPQQRQEGSEAIAVAMYQQNALTATVAQIQDSINRHRERLPDLHSAIGTNQLTVTEIASDLQLCSFLKRNALGEFSFAHRSLMEFFVARHHYRTAYHEFNRELFSQRFSKEVMYFLASFAVWKERIWHRMQSWLDQVSTNRGESDYCRNLASVLISTPGMRTKLSIARCEISDATIAKSTISHATLNSTRFDRVEVKQASFVKTEMKKATMANITATDWSLQHSQIDCTIRASTFTSCAWTDCACTFHGTDAVFTQCRFIQGEILFAATPDTIPLKFNETTIERARSVQISHCELSSLSVSAAGTVHLHRTTARNSEFAGVRQATINESQINESIALSTEIIIQNHSQITKFHISECTVKIADKSALTNSQIIECKDVVAINASIINSRIERRTQCTAAASKIVNCAVADSTFALSNQSLVSGCVITGTSTSAKESTRLEACTILGGAIHLDENASFNGGTISNSATVTGSKGEITRSTIESSALVGCDGLVLSHCTVTGKLSIDNGVTIKLSTLTGAGAQLTIHSSATLTESRFQLQAALQAKGATVNKCTFDNCQSISLVSAAITSCDLSNTTCQIEESQIAGSKFISTKCTISKSTLQGCKFESCPIVCHGASLQQCEFSGKITIRGDLTASSLGMESATAVVTCSGSITNLQANGGQLHLLIPQDTSALSCSHSRFRNMTVIAALPQEDTHSLFANCQFDNCRLFGLVIPSSSAESCTFDKTSCGVVFVLSKEYDSEPDIALAPGPLYTITTSPRLLTRYPRRISDALHRARGAEQKRLQALIDQANINLHDNRQSQSEISDQRKQLRESTSTDSAKLEELKQEEVTRAAHLEKLKQEEVTRAALLEELKQEETARASHIEELKREEMTRSTQLEELKQEETALTVQLEELKQEETARAALLEKLKQEEAALAARLEELKQEEAALAARLEELKQEEAALTVQLEELKQEEAALQHSLETNESLLAGLSDDLLAQFAKHCNLR